MQTTIAHHPDCPKEIYAGVEEDFYVHCTCGGPERPFYPRRVCVRCWRPVKQCKCARPALSPSSQEAQ